MQTRDRAAPTADDWVEPAWDVALLFPAQGNWSVEEFLALETNRLVEFSHGRIEVLPMPSDKHQSIVAYLFGFFLAYAQQTGGRCLLHRFAYSCGRASCASRI